MKNQVNVEIRLKILKEEKKKWEESTKEYKHTE